MPPRTAGPSVSDPRRHIKVLPERVADVSSTDFPGHYPGKEEEHSWDLARFKKNLQVKVTRLSQRSVEFDLVGVDASIANAIRRILIAEVPTIAIEHVYVWNNTSVIVDEVLSHRLGLVPLNVDPALLDERDPPPDDQATDRNTIVFRLHVACERKKKDSKAKGKGKEPQPVEEQHPDELYVNHEVLSGQLEWVPQGDQASYEPFIKKRPAPTNPDIVLAKLRPGQEIEMELHAVKSVGKDHAKFCPVATASYRLLPHIILNPDKPVPPEYAEKFQKCFAPGVIKVDPKTKAVSVDQKNVRKETMSREVFRHPEFEGCVDLRRVRDYFLFNIESEGAYEPQRLMHEAVSVMRSKIATIRRAAEAIRNGASGYEDVVMGDA
ncbi:RBP11-like subunits of RNA polymerase [Punctularia strigosozonata HHB-11173 SS5]|uniref:RBP11-like subunits of RNA polymerase n=1 Tax=Punctularia strigosozonata (strain HHB-11173) TaxID=741275 RepID=UPI00044182E4|nr:RBP11-like subunits of RNA polymerase [Punctularia strigosozonata HHB-11173 SS5]EIN06450.1 RBP11-like subunits of RNA polymerase [Punctularia strigosozonata HHB-11173 SS5]